MAIPFTPAMMCHIQKDDKLQQCWHLDHVIISQTHIVKNGINNGVQNRL